MSTQTQASLLVSFPTQTSNNVEISLPAIRFTLLSPQLLPPDLAESCPLRMLRISLLIKLAQAMACSVLLEELLLLLLLMEWLLPCSVIIVLLRVSCVSLFVLLVLMIFERVWLFNTVVVVVVVVVVLLLLLVLVLVLLLLMLLLLLERLTPLNMVLGIMGGLRGRSTWFTIQANTHTNITNHNMKVNKNTKRKERKWYQLADTT